MNVAQLQKRLRDLPPDMRVVLSSDSEGNMKSLLAEAETLLCSPADRENAEIEAYHPDDEGEAPRNCRRALVLYPTR